MSDIENAFGPVAGRRSGAAADKPKTDPGPGAVVRVEDIPHDTKLKLEGLVRVPHGWWIIVHPDTPEHRDLAGKLAGKKPGELVPLTLNEMARLVEFQVWPMQLPPTASF